MISVIGLGFVGLTTALGFCEKGFKVYGYDIDFKKTEAIKEGNLPFFEPGLKEKLRKHLDNLFEPTQELSQAIQNSKIVFICVGTPSYPDGSADLQYIFNALKKIISSINDATYRVLVIKSSVPPATTQDSIKPFIEKLGMKVGNRIGLANNPEFLREGHAWQDFLYPDRIVIGEGDSRSGKIVEEIYQSFNAPIHRVSLNTAEYIKYLSNTLLATMISFSNEQSLIASSIGNIDIKKAFQIVHQDKRWSGTPANMSTYVYPGCGYGGYCLPKDIQALIQQSLKNGFTPGILMSVHEMNQTIKESVIADIAEKCRKEETVGILGLSFKPNSDDVRQTPAKDIIEGLLKKGFNKINAYDPVALKAFQDANELPISYLPTLEDTIANSGCLIILTAWDEFTQQEEKIRQKQVFDYRYLF